MRSSPTRNMMDEASFQARSSVTTDRATEGGLLHHIPEREPDATPTNSPASLWGERKCSAARCRLPRSFQSRSVGSLIPARKTAAYATEQEPREARSHSGFSGWCSVADGAPENPLRAHGRVARRPLVSHVRSDDGGLARAEHSFLSVDPDRQMTLDNGPGLLLGVLVLVHVWRSRRDLVAR